MQQQQGCAWREWPEVEVQRLMDIVRVPLIGQELVAGPNGVTGAYIAYVDANPARVSKAGQYWLNAMHRSERIGLIVAGGTTGLLLILILGQSGLKRARRQSRGRRDLARKTAARPFTEERRRQIEIAEVPLPEWSLTRHMLLPATTGAGKSTVISSLIAQIRERGHSGIVLDYRSEQMSHFYQPGDLILNHFEARGFNWSPLAEFNTDYELDHVIENYLPCTGVNPSHDHFQKAGQVILEPIFRAAKSNLEI